MRTKLRTRTRKWLACLVAVVLAASLIPASALATLALGDDGSEELSLSALLSDAEEETDADAAADEAADAAATDEDADSDDASDAATTASNRAVITAAVTLSGRAIAAHQFAFTLTDVTDSDSGTDKRTTTNDEDVATGGDADGTVEFPTIVYTSSDVGNTYTYEIAQTDEGAAGYIYDTSVYTVKVAVTQDDDGEVVATATYYDTDGTTELDEAPTFKNAYKASSTLTLTAWVELERGTLIADQFTFELAAASGTDADGATLAAADTPMPSSTTTTNTAAGAILFPVTFDEDDAGATYTYTISQVAGTDAAIKTYDESTYTYTVTVVDDGDGTLSFTQTTAADSGDEEVDDDEPVFVNVSEDGALSVTKEVTTGPDATFTFTVTLSGDYIESDGSYSYTVVSDSDDAADDADEEDADAGADASAAASTVVESLQVGSALSYSALYAAAASDEDADADIAAAADASDLTFPYSATCGSCTWKVSEIVDEDGEVTGYELHIYPTKGSSGTLASLKDDDYQPWSDYASLITKVTIDEGVTAGAGVAYMFAAFTALESIDLTNLNITDDTNDFAYMFYYCTSLESIEGLGEWDTSGATHMTYMFLDCLALESIDGISDWDVSQVENFSYMFHGCISLESLDLSGWTMNTDTTDSVEGVNMQHMFSSYVSGTTSSQDNTAVSICDRGTMAITEIALPQGFVTAAISDISYMFAGCANLTSVSVSTSETTTDEDGNEVTTTTTASAAASWDVSNVENFDYVFFSCSSLEELDVSGWDTSSGTTMGRMFSGCSSLTELEVGHFVMTNVVDSYYMFYYCSGLEEIDVAHKTYTDDDGNEVECWNTKSLVNMYNMFQQCRIVEELDVSGWDTSSVTQPYAAFADCYKLEVLDVSGWDTSSFTRADRMFRNCRVLETIDVSGWDTAKIKHMYQMFYNCYVVEELDVSGWNTAAATDMYQMFMDCYAITELDLSSWDTGAVTGLNVYSDGEISSYGGMAEMFEGCSSLQVVHLGETWSFYGSSAYKTEDTATCSPAYLPEPSCTSGMWVRSDATYGPYNPYELSDTYWDEPDAAGTAAQMAGTWVWYYPSGSYQVRYDANADGGEYDGSMATQTVDIEADIVALAASTYQRTGYTFTGWNTAADGTGVTVADAATLSAVIASDGTASVTLYVADDDAAESDGAAASAEGDADDADDDSDAAGTLLATLSAGGTLTLYAQWTASESSGGGTWTTTITLSAGQTAVFSDLPAGTTYTVTEGELASGWYQDETATTGTSGTIVATETAQATFTNYYDPSDTSASLEATVYLDGVEADAGAFSFVLYSCASDGTLGSALQSGVANASGGAVSFDTLSYTSYDDIGTYYYAIDETLGTDADIDYDTHIVYVKVVVSEADAALSAEVTYSEEPFDEAASTDVVTGASFYNYTKGSLVVKKIVEGTDADDKDFTFTVVLKDADGEALSDVAYTLTAADGTTSTGSIDSGGTVTLRAGEQVQFTRLSAGTTYEVSETSLPDGYTLSSLTEDGKGTISAGAASTVTATNTYAATGTWTPDATLVLEGGIDLEAGLFSFAVYDSDGTKLGTGTNEAGAYDSTADSASGAILLDYAASYTLDDVGRHVYTIVQTTTSYGNYTCDTTTWTVVVTVSDNGDGTLSVTASYSDGDVSGLSSAEFVNEYNYEVSLPTSGAGGFALALAGGLLAVLVCAAAALLHTRRRENPRGRHAA